MSGMAWPARKGNSMSADLKQVGGSHYKKVPPEMQHWNIVLAYKLCYFEAQILKYLLRWRDKNGVDDLLKAQHFLEKLIENQADGSEPGSSYVNQDR